MWTACVLLALFLNVHAVHAQAVIGVMDDNYDNYDNCTVTSNLHTLMIYRAWYDDEAAWQTFLRAVATDAGVWPVDPQAPLELHNVPFTIVEAPSSYRNATRDVFRAWIDTRPVEEDGGEPCTGDLYCTSRYRFCLYADRDTILSARPVGPTSFGATNVSYEIKGYAILLKARFDDDPVPSVPDGSYLHEMAAYVYKYFEWQDMLSDEKWPPVEGYPPIGGLTPNGIVWQDIKLQGKCWLDGELEANTLEWYRYYQRPPLTHTDGQPPTEL